MKHVEPRPWLSVNFPSLCKAWNVEYHVYRGWYGEKTEKDLFYEIRNNAYFDEFSFVDAVWDVGEILGVIAEHQAFYMTRRGAFRWIFRDKERLQHIILEFLEKTVEFPEVIEKPAPLRSENSVERPDKYSAIAFSKNLSAKMTKRGFTTEIGGLSPSEAYWSGKMSFDEAIEYAKILQTMAESSTVCAEEAADLLHRVASASTVTSKRF